jgi:DNA-binding NarL/FixJ family response regulator
MRCSDCGRGNRRDAAFCDACGAKLDAAAERTPAATVSRDFVGRESELSLLDAALDSAVAGKGRLTVITGEPGMGKSRLAQEVGDHALARNMQVLWGRCYEEPGAPAYWPWIQAIRAYAQHHGQDKLAAVGPGVAEHISEQAQEPVQSRRNGPVDRTPERTQSRFLLLDEISRFWRAAAEEQPVVLILDDLHWADISSLRLLEFMARVLDATPMMVLGTYSDIELSRQHLLSNTLGELARNPNFLRIRLTGLALDECGQMIKATAGYDLPPEIISALHAQTEGNPLFFLEIARFLQHQGSLAPAAVSLGWRNTFMPRIPEGVREVIGTRLNRLSPACNRVLAQAAVIGRRFGLAILNRVIDNANSEHCLEMLGEALAARVIADTGEPGMYHFSQALLRDTLYEEIPPPLRATLHHRVGAALEELYSVDLNPHVPLLAHHFCLALPGGDPAKARRYAVLAGERAESLVAHEEAARHYRLALLALELEAPVDEQQRCALLLALGEAQAKAGELLQAREAFSQAAARASPLQAFDLLARAALGYEDVNWRLGSDGNEAARFLDDALRLSSQGDTILKARLLAALVRARYFAGDFSSTRALCELAMSMARRIGDPGTTAACLLCVKWASEPWAQDDARVTEHSLQAIGLARQAGDRSRTLEAMAYRLDHLFVLGDLQGWEAEFEAFSGLSDQLHEPFFRYVAAAMRGSKAVFEGQYEEGERLARRASSLGQRWLPNADGVLAMQMFTVYWGQGRLDELASEVRRFVDSHSTMSTWRPGLALLYREIGQTESARAEFESLAMDGFAAVPRDALWLTSMAFLAEVCTELGDAARAPLLYRFLSPRSGFNIQAGLVSSSHGPAERYLGVLCTTMHEWADAQRHFDAALRMCAQQGAKPWLAHAQLDYAMMLLRRRQPGDREHAQTLLEHAIALGQALGMKRIESRAQALRNPSLPAERDMRPAGLSKREVEVLRLISEGNSNQEIGERLFVSPNTVAAHIRNILEKTNSANRAEAAAFAVRHGLVDPPPPGH